MWVSKKRWDALERRLYAAESKAAMAEFQAKDLASRLNAVLDSLKLRTVIRPMPTRHEVEVVCS